MIVNGECLEIMKTMETNSIDAIITDPPYGLSFMGKKWDYDVPSVEIWKECLRVLKPGGYLLSFAGTRTQHRMACNIEDAGFEIRDMIAWVYGSGFPKSLNIGKAVDKLQGNEREVIGERTGAVNPKGYKTDGIKQRGGAFRDGEFTDTKGTSEYEGFGTALKPALEPITVARKPLSEKTVAENVLKWGTGGINIDGCRVDAEASLAKNWDRVQSTKQGIASNGIKAIDLRDRVPTGRFPANLIHDGSDEVESLFPECKTGDIKPYKTKNSSNIYGGGDGYPKTGTTLNTNFKGDSGSASRFFYCAKASKSERNKGCEDLEEKTTQGMRSSAGPALVGEDRVRTQLTNNHPTVKPITLMRYLCRLVTPHNGIVLDPFCGSGSTLIGAKLEGFKYIGIEMDSDYIKIAENRLKAW